jgi:tRNA (guanine37-N1)-methyltransferase
VAVRLHNIRHYATDKHRTADDYPYGGGAGMVMKVEPVFRAAEWVYRLPSDVEGISFYEPPVEAVTSSAGPLEGEPDVPIILLGPRGRLLTHEVAEELARHPRIILICGHYEGIDERVRDHLATDEISIGDYVITGGELAAMVVADATARLLPGVLAEGSAHDESHAEGLLEYPQYTRPAEFRGWRIPDILVSGHHAEVAKWRRREALRLTAKLRPDLLISAELTDEERRWLSELI